MVQNGVLILHIWNIVIKGIAVTVLEHTGSDIGIQPVGLYELGGEQIAVLGIAEQIVLVIGDHSFPDIFIQYVQISNLSGILKEGIQGQVSLGGDGVHGAAEILLYLIGGSVRCGNAQNNGRQNNKQKRRKEYLGSVRKIL